jgi:hypothetical protein
VRGNFAQARQLKMRQWQLTRGTVASSSFALAAELGQARMRAHFPHGGELFLSKSDGRFALSPSSFPNLPSLPSGARSASALPFRRNAKPTNPSTAGTAPVIINQCGYSIAEKASVIFPSPSASRLRLDHLLFAFGLNHFNGSPIA